MDTKNLFSAFNKKDLLMALGGIGLLALGRAIYHQAIRFDFNGKVVLITGGSRGLGLELARVLAVEGARIAICARSEDELKIAQSELALLGGEVFTVSADLTDSTAAQDVFNRVIDHYGQVDVLINNAGVMLVGPENVLDPEDYRKVLDANLWSAMYMVNAAVPHFRAQGQGRIANICSIGGKIAVPHMLPYSVSKFALTGFSEGLSAELAKDNIRVTTVVPNLMRTGSPRNVSLKGDHEAEYSWFKISDSLPLFSQNAQVAAKEIVEAIALGRREIILTPIAKIVTGLQGLAPGAVTTISQAVNYFMPLSSDSKEQKGYESESPLTTGKLATLTDEAAQRNNEI